MVTAFSEVSKFGKGYIWTWCRGFYRNSMMSFFMVLLNYFVSYWNDTQSHQNKLILRNKWVVVSDVEIQISGDVRRHCTGRWYCYFLVILVFIFVHFSEILLRHLVWVNILNLIQTFCNKGKGKPRSHLKMESCFHFNYVLFVSVEINVRWF